MSPVSRCQNSFRLGPEIKTPDISSLSIISISF